MHSSRPARVVAAIAGLAAATSAVVATQVTAAPTDTTIYACKAKKGGALRSVSKKAKCGKSGTKISWNTAGRAGPTSESLIGFTETAGVTLQPGADWVTLGTVTFTASTAFRYDPEVSLSRYSVYCPGSTPNTMPYTSTSMSVVTRYVVNGVAIPGGITDDGGFDSSLPNLTSMKQSWLGPVTLTVLARTTSISNTGLDATAIAPCAVDSGTVQFYALAYSV
ncbi:MAG: hypothetical protein EXQ74_03495 [Thermoleophilia bacterium]|nr:hypothetical protein [Thermoleophilia bacterium]